MKKFLLLTGMMLFSISTLFAQAKPSTAGSVTDGSDIEFVSETHDFGKLPLNSTAECEFTFKNTGNAPLVLSNVRASCGCTVPSWPKEPVAPGETAVIKVKYTTNTRAHVINKSIVVSSNAVEAHKTIVLRIKGEFFDPAASTNTNPQN